MTDKQLEKLISKAYKGSGILNEAVSVLAKEAQKYTDVDIYGTWVDGDGPVLGFDELDGKGLRAPCVIPPEVFFDKAKKLKKGEKFSADDLNEMGI